MGKTKHDLVESVVITSLWDSLKSTTQISDIQSVFECQNCGLEFASHKEASTIRCGLSRFRGPVGTVCGQ